MQKYTIKSKLIPQVIEALTKKNVKKYTAFTTDIGQGVVCSDISAREMKRVKRIAWALTLSKEIGLPVITREDIGNLRTGVIPQEEKYWLERARL